MLKGAGVDRFPMPRRLREFDPKQIDNFARMYSRHSVAQQRFLDDVHFLERYTCKGRIGVRPLKNS